MKKQIFNSPLGPTPIGPYNQAVRTGNLVYTSGQIALDPKSGEVLQGDVTAQSKLVLTNLKKENNESS